MSSDAPVVLQVIDQPDRLRSLLPHLEEMMSGGLMTLHELEVIKYTHLRPRGLPTKLLVRQVMEIAIATVLPDTSVATIIDLLLEAPFCTLPVVDGRGHLQGIISTGDLIKAGILPMRRGLMRTALELDTRTSEAVEAPLEQARQRSDTAQDIMNRQVRTVEPNQSIREAAQIMLEMGLRRLPVIESDGKLAGMLSRADLLQVIVTSPLMSPHASSAAQPLRHTRSLTNRAIQQQPIADYSSTDVATVGEQAPLADVIDALILSPLKRVIVVDNQRRVRGIISDVDVLARMQEEMRPGFLTTSPAGCAAEKGDFLLVRCKPLMAKRVAADLMNHDVTMVTETTSIQETIEQMISTRRKVLPVIDAQGHLVGVVGRSDLLRTLVEGEVQEWQGKPLYRALLELAQRYNIAGATVLRGIEGFGPEHRLSTERLSDISDNLPLVLEIVESGYR